MHRYAVTHRYYGNYRYRYPTVTVTPPLLFTVTYQSTVTHRYELTTVTVTHRYRYATVTFISARPLLHLTTDKA